MIIKVNQNHIDNGKRSNPFKCPVALSLNEKYPKYRWEVYPEFITNSSRDNYNLSQRCKEFIYNFDMNFNVEPSNFSILKEAN